MSRIIPLLCVTIRRSALEFLLLAGWPILGGHLVASLNAALPPHQEYLQDCQRITSCHNAKNFADMLRACDEVSRKWSSRDGIEYGNILFHICHELNDTKLGNEAVRLTQIGAFAKSALENRGLPAHKEMILARHLQRASESQYQIDWPNSRAENARISLRVWQRLNKEMDRNFDTYDKPKKETVAHVNQRRLHDLRPAFCTETERYLVNVYTRSPFNTPELSSILDEYLESSEVRSRILKQVTSRELTERARLDRDTSARSYAPQSHKSRIHLLLASGALLCIIGLLLIWKRIRAGK